MNYGLIEGMQQVIYFLCCVRIKSLIFISFAINQQRTSRTTSLFSHDKHWNTMEARGSRLTRPDKKFINQSPLSRSDWAATDNDMVSSMRINILQQ